MEPLLSNLHAIFKFDKDYKLFDQVKSANLYYLNSKLDLVNGDRTSSSENNLKQKLDELKLSRNYDKPIVIVNYYELGELIELGRVSDELPLCLIIEFENVSDFKIEKAESDSIPFEKVDDIEFNEYSKMFKTVIDNLEYGNCYQINLTTRSAHKYNCELKSLYRKFLSFKNHSEFAHTIHIPSLDQLILSNSPECLFIKEASHKIVTRPIKGTIAKEYGKEALANSEKDESELNIITDLLRNDLSRIGNNFSRVISKKSFLEVPGLIHQYSEIEVDLNSETSVKDILWALFPGGSITGAPKKRVVQLIKEIEKDSRGIYTGSTILLYKDKIKSSINIRTADINSKSKILSYGSGGGITLNSKVDSEYQEMKIKKSSFLNIFS
jgi:anthranilate/para-aminobenzoate synthase component I